MKSIRSDTRPLIVIAVLSLFVFFFVPWGSNDGTSSPLPPTVLPPPPTAPVPVPPQQQQQAPPPPAKPDDDDHKEPATPVKAIEPAPPTPVEHVDTPSTSSSLRSIGNDNCPKLRKLAKAMFNLPSDIQLLLGILRAYVDDSNTVLELGSRQGSSTSMILESAPKRFATVDLSISTTVGKMHEYGRACTASKATDYFTVQGDDMYTPIPFSTEGGVEMMFLDTLHAAWLLEGELRRYPPHVHHYMAFHDSFSFLTHDEVYPGVEERRNEKSKNWKGLRVVFEDFLRTHADEWVEDMSYIHNNGLYVMRRKSYTPTLPTPSDSDSYARFPFEEYVSEDLMEPLISAPHCRAMFRTLGPSPGSLCRHSEAYHRRTSLTNPYIKLMAGRSPLARQLPVIFGHAIAVRTIRVTECDTAVVLAVLHAALSEDRTLYVPSTMIHDNCPALELVRSLAPDDYRRIHFDDRTEVDLIVTRSGVSGSFEGAHAFILEYGTSVYTSKRRGGGGSNGFELHNVLHQKPGIGVWKKKGSVEFNYVK
eukprot:PhF_6_TR29403/c1_g1_i6/m.43419